MDGDKFAATGLTARKSRQVKAPSIDECYASFECRLSDDRMVDDYSFFIWEIVKAHVAAGRELDCKKRFRPENL